MSDVVFEWKGEKVMEAMDAALNAGIDAATITAAAEMERESSKRYAVPVRSKRKTAAGVSVGRTWWRGRGSPKGGFPGKRTGQLTASMGTIPARGLKGAFGAATNYAEHVHKDRPFLRLTVTRFGRKIEDAFVRTARKRLAAAAETASFAEGAD